MSVWIGGERAAVFSLQFSPEGILSQMCEQTLAVAVGGRGFGAEQMAERSQVTAVWRRHRRCHPGLALGRAVRHTAQTAGRAGL